MEKAWCVKCRSHRSWQNKPKLGKTKNNRVALAGKCNHCNTKMVRFVSNNELQSGNGLLGKLLGLPGGKVPGLGSIPILGALF